MDHNLRCLFHLVRAAAPLGDGDEEGLSQRYASLLPNSSPDWDIPQWMFGDAWETHTKMAHHLAMVKLQSAENNFGAAVVNKVRHDIANEQAAAGAEAYENAGASSTQVCDVTSDQGLAIEAMLLREIPIFRFL